MQPFRCQVRGWWYRQVKRGREEETPLAAESERAPAERGSTHSLLLALRSRTEQGAGDRSSAPAACVDGSIRQHPAQRRAPISKQLFVRTIAPILPFLAPPGPPLPPPLPFFSGSFRLPIVLLTTLAGPKNDSRRPCTDEGEEEERSVGACVDAVRVAASTHQPHSSSPRVSPATPCSWPH